MTLLARIWRSVERIPSGMLTSACAYDRHPFGNIEQLKASI